MKIFLVFEAKGMKKYQLFDRTLFGDTAWLFVYNMTMVKFNCGIFQINLTLIFSIIMTKETSRN